MNEAVVKRLEELTAAGDGLLKPEAVVADARSESSPLHPLFDWNDSTAAEKWRLEQARSLIRSVKIVVKNETRSISVVRYVQDPASRQANEQGYRETQAIAKDEDLARLALLNEFARAAACLQRARELAAAFDMAGEVEALASNIVALRERVSSAEQLQA